MRISTKIFRGLTMFFAMLLVLSIAMASIMEYYRSSLDENTDALSSQVVVDSDSGEWSYGTQFTSVADAVAGLKDFAIREAAESFVLLKNEDSALPLTGSKPKVTLFGLRSYAAYYGSTGGGSIPDKATVDLGNTATAAFQAAFDVNPEMLAAYEAYCNTLTWGSAGFGAQAPVWRETVSSSDPMELTPDELAGYNPDYASAYEEYNDAAIVVLGRTSGENVSFYPGEVGRTTTSETGTTVVETNTGNILGISKEEQEIIDEAKENFDNVIVLLNSSSALEIEALKDDPDIDAVMWIGYPGVYGFEAVASVLKGETAPSGHLGDVYAVNSALAPAMWNYGGAEAGSKIVWADKADYTGDENVNSYLIQAEGIYTGYRYYETRYADVIEGNGGAANAAAGTYVTSATDYRAATVAGTWDYSNEVSYPFGYGLSYTTFEQELGDVQIAADKKTATVEVTVTNTGSAAGKSVVQLYAQAPYTEGGVEKSAIQLIDYEKTDELAGGASETIVLNVDLSNLASYDYEGAKTFVVDAGTYYFAIGDDSHDALNNILAAKGETGMVDNDGQAVAGDTSKVYDWTWSKDTETFSVNAEGNEISNRLTEGDYAMDVNAFIDQIEGLDGEVVYLSRSDWNGTWPITYAGLSVKNGSKLESLLKNDFIPIETTEDTSDIITGDTSSDLTFNDMKGAEFDDPRWDELVNKIPVSEALDFMANAFHNIQGIPSIEFNGYAADDGPGGSDSHTMKEAQNRGQAMADAEGEYATTGTRIAPAPINLAYTWNKELAYENGQLILGESTLLYNLPIMIGPGGNIHRHAYNGRGVEYYSEDPILSGFTGSAVVQGAQSKGTLVNIKHAAFNDQESNRSGVAVFMNEQGARELELRNLYQMFTGKGRSSKMDDTAIAAGETANRYGAEGALGVMSSYNRIGAVASSANKAVMVDIMRGEWGFKGYNVTDFTGVSLKAAPKESILFGTTNFCGFGNSVSYWSEDALRGDADMMQAIHDDMHYALYALSRSYAMDLNVNTHVEWLMTWYRATYISLITVFSVASLACVVGYVVCGIRGKNKKEAR